MAQSLNLVQLIGRLGKDPEQRVMQSGDPVVNFSLATTETWKQDGEKKERTHWHNVVCFNKPLCEVIMNYVSKGSLIYLSGSLETRSWEQDGQKKYTTEIVLRPYRGELTMLDGRSGEQQQPMSQATQNAIDEMEDEIPF